MAQEPKQLLYLYDLPKELVTSTKIDNVVKEQASFELGPNNQPQIRRDPNKPFYSAIIKITDHSKYNDVAQALRTFKIEGKECRALPFDKSFLGTNRALLKDYTIFVKFDKSIPAEKNVNSTEDLYKFAENLYGVEGVKSVKVSINQDHSSRGYGFITFKSQEDAKKALEKKPDIVLRWEPYNVKDRRDARKTFNNIYVKNYPESWNEENIKEAFGKYGPIKSVAVKSFKLPNEEKEAPFAFICYEDPSNKEVGAQAAYRAIEDLNGKEYEGKQLYVREALKKKEREQEKTKEQLRFKNSKKRCNLYVKNFPQNTKKEELLELFGKFGQIESLKLMPKEEEALYAFVCYASPDQAALAKQQLNSYTFNGKQLYVHHYELKEVRKLQQEEIRDNADYQNFMKQQPGALTFDFINKPEIFQLIQFLMGHLQRQQNYRGGMRQGGYRQGGNPRYNQQ